MLSTAFRLAQYWGAVEFLYGNVDRLHLESDKDTAQVAGLIKRIGSTFSSDRYDNGRFMMWREEQRAIGELMIGDSRENGHLRLMGFASFADQYDDRFARWFAAFEADLRSPRAEQAQRLPTLEALFAELAGLLENQHAELATSNPPNS